MTTNYPGRDISEIMSLAADIVENDPRNPFEYVQEFMIPAARQEIEENGDSFIGCYGQGYHLSTALWCARKIANELETKGYIEP